MTPEEFAIDKGIRIVRLTVAGAEEVSALLASRPVDPAMTVEALVIVNRINAEIERIQMEAPPSRPGDILREVRRIDVPRGPISVAIRQKEGER